MAGEHSDYYIGDANELDCCFCTRPGPCVAVSGEYNVCKSCALRVVSTIDALDMVAGPCEKRQ